MQTAQSGRPRPKVVINRQQQTVQVFTERLSDDVGLEMVLIPAGSFLMGSPDDEAERDDSEGPQHQVEVPRFCMGKYPVTQAQWKIVAALPKVDRDLKSNPSGFKGNMLPVERVSWYDTVEFCKRLNRLVKRPGLEYRLPTEAEWEYACRAGTTTPFHFGETITTDLANYRGTDNEEYKWSGSYGDGPKGEYREKTTPVNHFQHSNAFGLHDMHGNVWEWCLDHWHKSYKDAPTDGSDWSADKKSTSRVIRGGSWIDGPRDCRSAYRDFCDPAYTFTYIGFRVVCAVPRSS